jgi:hypothetical protein
LCRPTPSDTGGPRREAATASFRVANCNSANFNYPGVRYAGRAGADGDPISQANYDHKVKWLAALMDTAMVDLVGFEELFHQQAITDLVGASKRLAGATIYAPDLAGNVQNGEARGPFCGLVTHFPIDDAQAIQQFPADVAGKLLVQRSDADPTTIDVAVTQFQRPVLRARVRLRPDVVATVFVAHLKSKREQYLAGEDPDDPVVQALGNARSLILRAAEAAALRSLVVAAATGNNDPIIVLGDLNDDLPSVTTQIVAGDDPYFLKGERKTTAFDRLLYSVHDLQERVSHRQVNYSHIYDARYELLDHIFVSQELVQQNPGHIAEVRSTRMYNDHLYDSRITHDTDDNPVSTTDHGIPVTEIAWTA